MLRLRRYYKTDVLISLIEDHEFADLQIATLRERAKDFEMENHWFPIRDQSVPASMENLEKLVEVIARLLKKEKNVVIHCMGGLGRTGLVAAACLIALTNLSAAEAVRAVRAARKGAVENSRQEEFVASFTSYYRKPRTVETDV